MAATNLEWADFALWTQKDFRILTLELRRCRFRQQDFFVLLYLQIFALQGVNFF